MKRDLSYRDFSIPKKNGKARKISAPSKGLLKYQRRLLPFLYKYHRKLALEKEIEHIQHGFIPDRNCVTAAQMHIGFRYTICMDLSNFFDSCNTKMFGYEITKYKALFHKMGYCAQGFASSPMLANIASLNFIEELNMKLEKMHQEISLEKDIKNDKNQLYAFTIYADDIQISTNHKSLLKEIIEKTSEFAEHYGFSINKNKTRVRCSDAGYRKILGINVGQDHIRGTRHTMRRIRAADHQGHFHSKGGLVAWSKKHLPKKLKGHVKSFFKA